MTVVGTRPVLSTAEERERTARRCIWVAVALTLFVDIRMFLFTTTSGDDLAWVWVNHWQGAAGIREYMFRVAHPEFGPIYNVQFWLGSDEPASADTVSWPRALSNP